MAKLSDTQCRMARAALEWGVRDLADKAGVSKNTITRLESGEGSLPASIDKVLQAFEKAGVTFSEAGCVCPPSKKR